MLLHDYCHVSMVRDMIGKDARAAPPLTLTLSPRKRVERGFVEESIDSDFPPSPPFFGGEGRGGELAQQDSHRHDPRPLTF